MRRASAISIRESKAELHKQLRKCRAAARPRIKRRLLLQRGMVNNIVLAAGTGVNSNCIAVWKQHYENQGLLAFLQENRGGHRQGAINKEVQGQIRQRLSDPQGGFTSYTAIMEWINTAFFGLQMKDKAVNQHLKYHFQTKLRVGRKSHTLKAPLVVEAFKKGAIQ